MWGLGNSYTKPLTQELMVRCKSHKICSEKFLFNKMSGYFSSLALRFFQSLELHYLNVSLILRLIWIILSDFDKIFTTLHKWKQFKITCWQARNWTLMKQMISLSAVKRLMLFIVVTNPAETQTCSPWIYFSSSKFWHLKSVKRNKLVFTKGMFQELIT